MTETNYIRKETCADRILDFTRKYDSLGAQLTSMDLKREQDKKETSDLRDETNKSICEMNAEIVMLRKRIFGNGHLEGSLAYDLLKIQTDITLMRTDMMDKINSIKVAMKTEAEKKDKKKDRGLAFWVLAVSNFTLIIIAVIDKFN